MRCDLFITPDANEDIEEIVHWYDLRDEDLGTRFINAVRQRFDRICENPTLARLISGSVVRKVFLPRDPNYISSRLTE